MLEWLKQRVISWLLSRTVGKWIAIDRQNLHAGAGTDEWTLVADNLLVRTGARSCTVGACAGWRGALPRRGVGRALPLLAVCPRLRQALFLPVARADARLLGASARLQTVWTSLMCRFACALAPSASSRLLPHILPD